MKSLFAIALMCLTAASTNPQQKKEGLGLPELHKIKTATLSPSYSCRSKQEFRRGYEKTALFLSTYSDDRNAPDLLFNGACGSRDYFQGSTAGDDMSMIADLGTIPLENATSQLVMANRDKDGQFFKFTREADVQPDHTYAVLIDKSHVRGLLVFQVAAYEPNKKVDIKYAVKEYQLLDVRAQSDGFDWASKNQVDCAKK
jgi:hypothetical protein